MSLIIEKTQLQQDLETRNVFIGQMGSLLLQALNVMQSNNNAYIDMPSHHLIAVLNHDVQVSIVSLQWRKDIYANLVDAIDRIGSQFTDQFIERSLATRNDITFNGTEFVYVAPPEPEP
jgi:DNA-binding cell septation regulator SpoVG